MYYTYTLYCREMPFASVCVCVCVCTLAAFDETNLSAAIGTVKLLRR